jgi:hypothetical protein
VGGDHSEHLRRHGQGGGVSVVSVSLVAETPYGYLYGSKLLALRDA